jgi:hypothetical protein
MDTSTLFKLTQTAHLENSQLSFAARLATITRRRNRNTGRRSRGRSGGDCRDRASSDHDLLRAPRPRGPTRRLCAIGSCRAQTYGRRVSRRRRRVRVRIYLLSSACDEHWLGLWPGLGSTRFVTMPGADDADLRMTYCAFVVCALLGDWSCIDLPRALSYIHRCRVRVPIPPSLHSFPPPLMYEIRRTKADTDKRHRANRSADRHIAPSLHYTSSRPTTYVRLRRVYSVPSGTRQYAGYYTCKCKLWHL